MVKRTGIAASVVVLGLAGSACTGPRPTAVEAVLPTAAPTFSKVTTGDSAGECVKVKPVPEVSVTSVAMPTVGPDPVAITVVWIPQSYTPACFSAIARGDASTARRIARDIIDAPSISSRPHSCAPFTVSGAYLYFSYTNPSRVEIIDAVVSGCPSVSAPGLEGIRPFTDDLARDLLPLAPGPWNQLIGM